MSPNPDSANPRGVILVEGAAEQILVLAFAAALGVALAALAVTVRTFPDGDFIAAIDALDSNGRRTPHVLLMARDGETREDLIQLFQRLETDDYERLDTEALIALARPYAYVIAPYALELELFRGGLAEPIAQILETELALDAATKTDLQAWTRHPDALQDERLITLVDQIGRERFAHALAPHVREADCPEAIREALNYIRDALA